MELSAKKTGNLGDEAQGRRLRAGVVGFALTLAAAVVAAHFGVAPWWRGIFVVPFFAASNALYAALYNT